jgi:hypothetical protein
MATFRSFLTLIGAVVLPSHPLRFICGVALFQAWRHAGLSPASNLAIAAGVFTALLSAGAAGVITGLLLQVERPHVWGGLLALVVLLEGGGFIDISSQYGALKEAQANALLAGASALLACLCYFATRARNARTPKALDAR